MVPQWPEDGFVRVPDSEFEAILTQAAEEGEKRALADAGIDGDEAALDIRDLRSLLDHIRFVRRTAAQTTARLITSVIVFTLPAGFAIKLKLFDNGPKFAASNRVTQRHTQPTDDGKTIRLPQDDARPARRGGWRKRPAVLPVLHRSQTAQSCLDQELGSDRPSAACPDGGRP